MMSEHEPKIERAGIYLVIYIALMVLLVLTVLASRFQLGQWNIVISLTIAVAKAVLVILFFMHVRHGGGLVKIFAGAAFLWLALMLGLTMTDYSSRGTRPASAVAPRVTLTNAADP